MKKNVVVDETTEMIALPTNVLKAVGVSSRWGCTYNMILEVKDGQIILTPGLMPLTYPEKIAYATKYLANFGFEKQIRFAHHQGTTVAILGRTATNKPRVGQSICDPKDNYSPVIGEAIALMRAAGEPQEIIEKLTK